MSLSLILQTPLLQGISRRDMLDIAAKAKLSFDRYMPGKKIVLQKCVANRLVIVLSGEVELNSESPCHRFRTLEFTRKPPLIGLESMFSLRQEYPCSVIARTAVETMCVEKADLRDLLLSYPVIRLNVLTQLSRQATQLRLRLCSSLPLTIEERFIRFVQHRLLVPVGAKMLKCRLTDLATELGVTRLRLSGALHKLQDDGLVEMGRSHIVIPNFERLLAKL